LYEKASEAFHDAKQLVPELDMDDPFLHAEMMMNIAMQDNQTIAYQLSLFDQINH
jgi:hypothetical protein